MTGQVASGTFDVNSLWVTEPPTADTPAQAIPHGGVFTFHMTFTGTGAHWYNCRSQGHHFQVKFHVEGVGAEMEADYTPPPIQVNLNQTNYEVTYTVNPNTLPVGLYRCGCTVEDNDWHGTVGFRENLLLQIYVAP